MPQYIRAFVPGGTFFFTITLLERRRKLLTEHIDGLRASFMAARQRRTFTVEAIVLLPDHLHCIWTLPSGDADFSTRWHDLKARFTGQIPGGERLSARRLKKRERGICQRRFWEHAIRDEGDYERHVDYLHDHPVKMQQAGCALLSRPTAFPALRPYGPAFPPAQFIGITTVVRRALKLLTCVGLRRLAVSPRPSWPL